MPYGRQPAISAKNPACRQAIRDKKPRKLSVCKSQELLSFMHAVRNPYKDKGFPTALAAVVEVAVSESTFWHRCN